MVQARLLRGVCVAGAGASSRACHAAAHAVTLPRRRRRRYHLSPPTFVLLLKRRFTLLLARRHASALKTMSPTLKREHARFATVCVVTRTAAIRRGSGGCAFIAPAPTPHNVMPHTTAKQRKQRAVASVVSAWLPPATPLSPRCCRQRRRLRVVRVCQRLRHHEQQAVSQYGAQKIAL